MQFALVYIIAITLPYLSVLAQRHHGGGDGGGGGGGGDRTGGGGGGGGSGGGSGSSGVATTFITMTATSTITAVTSTETVSGSANGAATVDDTSCPIFNVTANIKANDGTANCVGDKGALIPSVKKAKQFDSKPAHPVGHVYCGAAELQRRSWEW
ncbi:hypothetical protein LTS17_001511 [Exophiala oligosperma]